MTGFVAIIQRTRLFLSVNIDDRYHIVPIFAAMSKKNNTSDQDGMSLPGAFQRMLQQPDIWGPLKLAKQSILNMRVRMNKGDHPTRDLMHDWLGRAGWKCMVEEVWGPGPKWKPKPIVGRGRPKGSAKPVKVAQKAQQPKGKQGKKGKKR